MLLGQTCSDRHQIERPAEDCTHAEAADPEKISTGLVHERSGLGVQRSTHLMRPCSRKGAQCSLKAVVSADLLALWHVHGTGLVAKHTTLYFQDGALTAPSPAADAPRASQSCMLPHGY